MFDEDAWHSPSAAPRVRLGWSLPDPGRAPEAGAWGRQGGCVSFGMNAAHSDRADLGLEPRGQRHQHDCLIVWPPSRDPTGPHANEPAPGVGGGSGPRARPGPREKRWAHGLTPRGRYQPRPKGGLPGPVPLHGDKSATPRECRPVPSDPCQSEVPPEPNRNPCARTCGHASHVKAGVQ